MKRTLLTIGLFGILATSCQNELENDFFTQEESNPALTRNATSWESCTTCTLKSGASVALPWASSSSTSVPDEIREDIKEEDGWRILYTTVDILGYSETVTNADKGVNYLLLYNKYTGVLKGFYYAESMDENNHAYWLLNISGGTKLFNFISYFAEPVDSKNTPATVSLSNISNDGLTNGFNVGWNCFMTELAYDENSMNEKLSISAYALNEASIRFSGSYNSSSSGTIVSAAQGQSSSIEGLASSFGKAAKEWIKENTGTSSSKAIKYASSIADGIFSSGIKGIISNGLHKIFGSTQGTTQTTQNLQFSTNGKVTITGTSTTPGSGYLSPIAGIPLNGIGENLGVWNLSTVPINKIMAYGELQDIQAASSGSDYYYKITVTPTISIVTNPALGTSVSTSTDLVRIDKYNGAIPTFGKTYNKGSRTTWRQTTPNAIYSDSVTTIRESNKYWNIGVRDVLPNKTYGSSTPALALSTASLNLYENIAVKVKTTLYNSSTAIYSVKTFIPTYAFGTESARPYSWTYTELINKGY